MSMLKGANAPVPAQRVRVEFRWRPAPAGSGGSGVDALALLLDSGTGRVRSDADLVGRRHSAHPSGSVRHEDGAAGAAPGVGEEGPGQVIAVDLAAVEPAVEKVLLVASSDDGGLGRLSALGVRVVDAVSGAELARYDSQGATVETVLVLGELYRRQGAWKFRAVGQGYSSGAAGLAADYGITPEAARPAPRPSPAEPAPSAPAPDVPKGAPYVRTQAPTSAPAAPTPSAPAPSVRAARTPGTPPSAPVRLSKVTLTKEAPAVSLAQQGGTSGTLSVNLSWRTREKEKTQGWGARLTRALAALGGLDLDLCALYELADGRKGVVQALGNSFGALQQAPYIHLDGDDRTGGTSGENLTLNLDQRDRLRRVLVFVTVYEGASSFAGLDATVTLRPQHGAPVDFSLGECTVPSRVCALALITHTGSDLLVRREARFLVADRGVSPQETVDRAYGWGLEWTPGRK